MNKKFSAFIAVGFCVWVLAGCGAPPGSGSGGAKIRVTGTRGLAFTGTATGRTWGGKTVTQELSGTVPAEFTLPVANYLDYSIQKTGPGDLQITVVTGSGKSAANTGTDNDSVPRGVRGRIRPWSEMIQTF
jgi:hypothetical protein